MTFKAKFTRMAEGFSTNRRMPRLGKIRLGIKVRNAQKKEYPKETPYFVVPPEVARVYGTEPTELDVMCPLNDPELFFPQKLAMYGSSKGLVCHGNGQHAERKDETTGKWQARSCPCEFRKTPDNPKGACAEVGHLMVLLPKVNMGGVYQISTSSYHSVVDLNSGIDYVQCLVGRIALVPLKLRREPRETHHNGKKQTHYTLTLTLDANVEGINQLRNDSTRILQHAQYQIEGPVEENPAQDPVDLVVEAEEPDAPAKEATPSAATPSGPAPPPPAPPNKDQPADHAFADFLAWMEEDNDKKGVLKQVKQKFRLSSLANLPPEKQEQFRLTCEDYLRRHQRA